MSASDIPPSEDQLTRGGAYHQREVVGRSRILASHRTIEHLLLAIGEAPSDETAIRILREAQEVADYTRVVMHQLQEHLEEEVQSHQALQERFEQALRGAPTDG